LLSSPASVLANGTRLSYVQEGGGDPVVFVHSALSDLHGLAENGKALAKKFRVIVYSRRSHYPNRETPYDQDYSISTEATDLRALANSLELQQFHLVGESYGGYIATLFARHNPDNVKTLTVTEPPIISLVRSQSLADAFMRELSREVQYCRDAYHVGKVDEGIRHFVDWLEGEAGVYDQLPPEAKTTMTRNSHTFIAEIEAVLNSPVKDRFVCDNGMSLRMPVLAFRGGLSLPIFGVVIEELVSCLPQCRSLTINDATHGMLAYLNEFQHELLEFLESHPIK